MLKVLIIDDEIRRMRATFELLQADGFQVEQIDSPSRAWQRLKANPNAWDVILLDIMMPTDGEFDTEETDLGLRTGIILLEKIQTLSHFSTPIIVLTANEEFKDEVSPKVDKFLLKPTPYQVLKSIIQEVSKKAGGRDD